MKWILVCLCVSYYFGVLATASETTEVVEKKDATLDFKWFLISKSNDRVATLPPKRKIKLKSGDAFQVVIEPLSSLYLYLYLVDSDNKLHVIHVHESPLMIKKKHRIPGEENWFVLDDKKGIETFHLITSINRIEDLETATKQYEQADTAMNQFAVLKTIRKWKQKTSKISSRAEKPVPIAGAVRTLQGVGLADSSIHHVKTQTSYSKTFKIDHL